MPSPEFVIFLNGVYGVGKSTVLDQVGHLLADAGRPFSLLDVDWFHRSWPPAEDDPENVLTEAENLRAVWGNYSRTGARQPVVSGVAESEADRARYEAVFGLPVRCVLLTAARDVIERRLRAWHSAGDDRALRWHLDRHAQLALRLHQSGLNEAEFATDDVPAVDVARLVISHFIR